MGDNWDVGKWEHNIDRFGDMHIDGKPHPTSTGCFGCCSLMLTIVIVVTLIIILIF